MGVVERKFLVQQLLLRAYHVRDRPALSKSEGVIMSSYQRELRRGLDIDRNGTLETRAGAYCRFCGRSVPARSLSFLSRCIGSGSKDQ